MSVNRTHGANFTNVSFKKKNQLSFMTLFRKLEINTKVEILVTRILTAKRHLHE